MTFENKGNIGIRERRRRKKKRPFFRLVLMLIFVLFIGFLVGNSHSLGKLFQPSTPKKEVNKKQTIYPTIYIGGSGGGGVDAKTLSGYDPAIDAKQKSHLFIQSQDEELTINGSIAEDDTYPIISFGLRIGKKGTNKGEKYVEPLKDAVKYLQDHYNVPYINLIGHSSGATGAIDYIIKYSKDSELPKIHKFVSFDGEYNTVTPLQDGETLADVLLDGPRKKTKMYTYIENNYQRIDPRMEVLVLVGQKNIYNQSDGYIPWADGFSINYLLTKNGNPLIAKFYLTELSHANDVHDPTASAMVREFLKNKK